MDVALSLLGEAIVFPSVSCPPLALVWLILKRAEAAAAGTAEERWRVPLAGMLAGRRILREVCAPFRSRSF